MIFDKIKKWWSDNNNSFLVENSIDYFNVKRVDGIDYIYYNGVRITTDKDAKDNLLDRLDLLRTIYINEHKNK